MSGGIEVVFARGTNEHREPYRPREALACPVAKRVPPLTSVYRP
jgi:hypothetical protein